MQRCIPLVPEFEFVATCDLVEEKAQSNARRFGALAIIPITTRCSSTKISTQSLLWAGQRTNCIGISVLRVFSEVIISIPRSRPRLLLRARRCWVNASIETGKNRDGRHHVAACAAHQIARELMDDEAFGDACQYHTRYMAPGPRIQEMGSPFAWPFMIDQVIHPTDACVFLWGRSARFLRWVLLMLRLVRCQYPFNLRYENGGVGTMTLGTGPV